MTEHTKKPWPKGEGPPEYDEHPTLRAVLFCRNNTWFGPTCDIPEKPGRELAAEGTVYEWREVTMIVRNASGESLARGDRVDWKTGFHGKHVV